MMVRKKHFLGFFTIDIQHKTLPKLIPLSFYIFEDTTNFILLLSYSASIHLGIVEFKIPNEASANAMVSSVTNTMVDKKVSYKVPLCSSTPAKVIPMMPELKKLILKQKRTKNKLLQEHHNTLQNHNTTEDNTAQIHTEKQSLQDHQVQIPQKHSKNYSFQDHSSKVKCQFTHKHALQDPTAKISKNNHFRTISLV